MVSIAVTVGTTTVVQLVGRRMVSSLGKITIQNSGANPIFVADVQYDPTTLAAIGIQLAAGAAIEIIGTEGDHPEHDWFAIATGGSSTARLVY